MIFGRMVLSKINGLRKALAKPCIPIGIMMVNFSKSGLFFQALFIPIGHGLMKVYNLFIPIGHGMMKVL